MPRGKFFHYCNARRGNCQPHCRSPHERRMTERTPFVISTEKGCKPAEWRNLARLRIGRQTFFRRVLPYFTVQDKIPRLTLGMTGMGANILYCIHNFTFYILHSTFQKRSFDYAGTVVPAPLRMTGGRNDRGKSRTPRPQKRQAVRLSFQKQNSKNFNQKTGECSAAAAPAPEST